MPIGMPDNNIKSGIYKIEDKFTNQFYIGSAVNLDKRFINHLSDLNKNKHYNYKMQSIYNTYGKERFIFTVIEYVDEVNLLIEREQYYIDILNPDFNICKTAGNCLGRAVSQQTKNKISKALKGKPLTNETKRKMSISRKGKKQTEIWKQRKAEAAAKEFLIKSPTGEIIKGKNINKFARDNKLNQGDVRRVLKGESRQHKGWTKV